jgi:transmembrane sensor
MRTTLIIVNLLLVSGLAVCLFGSCGAGDTTVLGTGSYHIGKGSGRLFRLPDGSSVFVSPETTISLAKGFGRDNRDVELDGEARFDVAAKPGLPMVVHTRDMVIQVLGTRFKINAYRDKPGEEVDLLTGALKVTKSYHSDTDNEPEELKAGEMVMINRDIDLMEKEALNAEELDKLKGLW